MRWKKTSDAIRTSFVLRTFLNDDFGVVKDKYNIYIYICHFFSGGECPGRFTMEGATINRDKGNCVLVRLQ